MRDMPWMFYIPNQKVAEMIATYIYESGGVVVADPEQLPGNFREAYLHTVGDPEDGELPILIHAVDWTVHVEYNEAEPEYMARDVYTMADSPAQFFDSVESLPEGTPQRVLEWLDLDDED